MVAYNKFHIFGQHLLLGDHDFENDSIQVYLSDTTPETSGDKGKADLTEISAGNGYAAGGLDVASSLVEDGTSGGLWHASATDVVWSASGGTIATFQYVVLYNDTTTTGTEATSDALIAWWNYGSAVILNDGDTFTVDFANNRLFSLDSSDNA